MHEFYFARFRFPNIFPNYSSEMHRSLWLMEFMKNKTNTQRILLFQQTYIEIIWIVEPMVKYEICNINDFQSQHSQINHFKCKSINWKFFFLFNVLHTELYSSPWTGLSWIRWSAFEIQICKIRYAVLGHIDKNHRSNGFTRTNHFVSQLVEESVHCVERF